MLKFFQAKFRVSKPKRPLGLRKKEDKGRNSSPQHTCTAFKTSEYL